MVSSLYCKDVVLLYQEEFVVVLIDEQSVRFAPRPLDYVLLFRLCG